jgi:hypothetical protein
MNSIIKIGMPHLLGNGDLNLNQFAKIAGDIHWQLQCGKPSGVVKNGKRVYNSFLRIECNITDTFQEDDVLDIHSTSFPLDDYIYKSSHVFGKNSINMYTIGIHIDNHKIVKTSTTGTKDKSFWNSHKSSRKSIDTDRILNKHEFATYYLTDFNSAGILYCANYLNFAFKYMNQEGFFSDITCIDFFGNIQPNEVVILGQQDDNIIMQNKDNQPIAKFKLS